MGIKKTLTRAEYFRTMFSSNFVEGSTATNESDDTTDAVVLHRFFHKHADKIGKELLSFSKPSSEGDSTNVAGKQVWDELCALLVDLGPQWMHLAYHI